MALARPIVLAAALLVCAPASAAEQDNVVVDVFNQLSADYTDCFGYHMLAKKCAPETATPEQMAQMQSMIDAAMEGAIATGKAIGIANEAMAARLKLSMQSMGELIENRCVNFSVLIEKYGAFCRDLESDPKQRAMELREQQ